MGRIFTPEQVAARQVPEIGAHTRAAHSVLDAMHSRFIGQLEDTDFDLAFGGFDGAMVYGSVAKGSPGIRSDLDVLVTFSADRGRPDLMVQGYRQVFTAAEKRWKVKIESNICHSEQLTAGEHTIDAQFYDHLRTIGREWLVGDPLRGLRLRDESYATTFQRYYLHKTRSFTAALSDTSQETDYKQLQRALELPSALGRKALSTLSHYGLEMPNPGAMHKQEVLETIIKLGLLRDDDTSEPWEGLTEADQQYDEILSDTMATKLPLESYAAELNGLYQPSISNALRLATHLGSLAQRQIRELQAK